MFTDKHHQKYTREPFFLPRDAMLARYICRRRVSVCLSVTSRCSTETVKRGIMQTTRKIAQGL